MLRRHLIQIDSALCHSFGRLDGCSTRTCGTSEVANYNYSNAYRQKGGAGSGQLSRQLESFVDVARQNGL